MKETRSQDWLLINLSATDIISYISAPNNQAQIMVDIIVSVIINPLIIFALVVLNKRVFNFVVMARKWWVMSQINPNIEVEITLSGEIQPQNPKNFPQLMQSVLRSIHNFPIALDQRGVFRYDKRFTDFGGSFRIVANRPANKYEDITIIFSTNEMKLKKLNRNITEVQNYLLNNLTKPLAHNFKFSPDEDNEDVTIKFSETPAMLQNIRELNISELKSVENQINVTITNDKIRFIGNIEQQSIDKIENITKANLAS